MIRRWIHYPHSNTLIYDIGRNHWCENIGRAHKSNHIYLVVDLKNAVFFQKCHDPDCQIVDYKSKERPLPPEVNPYLNDSEYLIEGFDESDLIEAAEIAEFEECLKNELDGDTDEKSDFTDTTNCTMGEIYFDGFDAGFALDEDNLKSRSEWVKAPDYGKIDKLSSLTEFGSCSFREKKSKEEKSIISMKDFEKYDFDSPIFNHNSSTEENKVSPIGKLCFCNSEDKKQREKDFCFHDRGFNLKDSDPSYKDKPCSIPEAENFDEVDFDDYIFMQDFTEVSTESLSQNRKPRNREGDNFRRNIQNKDLENSNKNKGLNTTSSGRNADGPDLMMDLQDWDFDMELEDGLIFSGHTGTQFESIDQDKPLNPIGPVINNASTPYTAEKTNSNEDTTSAQSSNLKSYRKLRGDTIQPIRTDPANFISQEVTLDHKTAHSKQRTSENVNKEKNDFSVIRDDLSFMLLDDGLDEDLSNLC